MNEDSPFAYQLLTNAALPVGFTGPQERPWLWLHMMAGHFKLLFSGLFATCSPSLKLVIVYLAPSDQG